MATATSGAIAREPALPAAKDARSSLSVRYTPESKHRLDMVNEWTGPYQTLAP